MTVYLPGNEATWANTIQLCEDETVEFLTKRTKNTCPSRTPRYLGQLLDMGRWPLTIPTPL